MAFYDQADFDVRCEWGLKAVETLAPISDVIVIVDILSFSTAIEIATGGGAHVYPYKWKDESANEAFLAAKNSLAERLRRCTSGKELIERGFETDVELATEFNLSTVVPILKKGCYVSKTISPTELKALL
jgi:phosphosulfolactate phosphohydrolase-like enzyme